MPQPWKDTATKALHKERDCSNCSNNRGIALLSHACKKLIRIDAHFVSDHREARRILPKEKGALRAARSTVDTKIVMHRPQKFGRQRNFPLYMRFIDLQEVYDSVEVYGLLWKVFGRKSVPQKTIAVIRHFHDGIRACVRTDDSECSKSFEVKQGRR